MDRRAFLAGSAALLVAPLAAETHQMGETGKVWRIAYLTTTSPGGSPTTDAFLHGLRDLGYVEGTT